MTRDTTIREQTTTFDVRALVTDVRHVLGRGDLAAAASAVPAIAGGEAGDDVTQLLTAGGATAAATQLLPTDTAAAPLADGEEEPEKKKRSPWTWPLIALIILLVLVLGGTLWALFFAGDPEPEPTTTTTSAPKGRPHTTSSATPTPTQPTPTPTPTEDRVDVSALGLTGQTCDAARGVLEENDLVADCQTGNAAGTADQVGIIYEVNPTGRVEPGTTITLTAYGDQVEMPTPATPSLDAQTVAPGDTLTVTWEGYSCPAGEGSPSSYNLTATNGTFSNGQSESSFGQSERNAQLTVPNNATGTVIVTYTVTCSGGEAGQRESPGSGEATATIEPAPTASPTP